MSRHTLPSSVCGIYHLMKNGHVLYVGQSTNVISRVASWAAARPGEFDSWEFFACDANDLNDLEHEHIERFAPPMNKAGREINYRRVNRCRVPRAAVKYGSVSAYLKTQAALIPGAVLRNAGLMLSNRQIMAMPGFPRPVSAKRNGKRWFCYWRRDDVQRWFERKGEAA